MPQRGQKPNPGSTRASSLEKEKKRLVWGSLYLGRVYGPDKCTDLPLLLLGFLAVCLEVFSEFWAVGLLVTHLEAVVALSHWAVYLTLRAFKSNISLPIQDGWKVFLSAGRHEQKTRDQWASLAQDPTPFHARRACLHLGVAALLADVAVSSGVELEAKVDLVLFYIHVLAKHCCRPFSLLGFGLLEVTRRRQLHVEAKAGNTKSKQKAERRHGVYYSRANFKFRQKLRQRDFFTLHDSLSPSFQHPSPPPPLCLIKEPSIIRPSALGTR